MKKTKLIISIFIIILSFNNIIAQDFVNESEAKKIGTNFVSINSQKNDPELDLVYTITDKNLEANLYIFNIKESGFVIVSATKKERPILAYSFDNNFNDENYGNAEYFINLYNNNIEHLKTSSNYINESASHLWNELENNTTKSKTTTIVSPLISTRWNQDCYYNEYAPYDNSGPCNRAYAGCVACAMSQIMKYWNYPENGKGSYSYNHVKYGNISADFGSTTYKWDEMPDEIWGHNDAIATLMYQCGVSVNMNYGPSGSGAQSDDVETAMRMYFGYSAAKYKERSSYQDEEWVELLKSELDESRPLYFSGTGEAGGHAIVCDGYDSNDFFHFNMGWSGHGDGYYSIDNVNGFNNNEAVVIDIRPLPINSDENGIIYVTPDGKGDGSSWENATCNLEYASAQSSNGNTQIWVKAGTYYGDTKNEKGAFQIFPKNRIYGGFEGNEAPDFNLDNRDLDKNVSIIDGENQRRVLYQNDHFSSSAYSIWDGFTIQNGYAGSGSAVYLCSNSYFYNCKFINNNTTGQGGAIYSITAINNNAKNIFENCLFENNSASMGGAIFDMCGLTLINNKFISNTASTKGGAYYVYMNKNPKVVNCIFANNKASEAAAIYNRGSITMTNCNIVNNEAQNSKGGLYNEVKYSKFYNSIFWGNTANGEPNQIEGESSLINCAVQDGYEGVNIINLSSSNNGSDNKNYPLFKNPDEYDYEPNIGSPLINAGENSALNLPDNDINYGCRIGQGIVDIGAYEYQGGISITETKEPSFSVYPNPFNHTLNITGDDTLFITIYNTSGQIIYSNNTENNLSIDTKDWNHGLYLININGKTYKIVK